MGGDYTTERQRGWTCTGGLNSSARRDANNWKPSATSTILQERRCGLLGHLTEQVWQKAQADLKMTIRSFFAGSNMLANLFLLSRLRAQWNAQTPLGVAATFVQH